MKVAWAFLKRDFLIAISYKASFVMQLVSIFIAVPVLSWFGRLFEGSTTDVLKAYEGNYFAFLLIGIAFIDYLAVSLRTFNQSLRDSQVMGTLEIMLLSPTTLAQLMAYSSLYAFALTTVRFLMYLLAGMVMFDLDLKDANVPAAAALLLLSVASFVSFGIMSASVIMVIKRGEIITRVVSTASFFLGGVLYPTTTMPEWLQVVSKFLPITHGLEGLRKALLQGASTAELLPQFGFLAAFAVVLLPVSLASFRLAVHRTKVTGTLGQY